MTIKQVGYQNRNIELRKILCYMFFGNVIPKQEYVLRFLVKLGLGLELWLGWYGKLNLGWDSVKIW